MGGLVLFYTSRVSCKGRMTREELISSLKHSWRFVVCEALELPALAQGVDANAACIQAEGRNRHSQGRTPATVVSGKRAKEQSYEAGRTTDGQ
jgi:hypothetical protein